MSTNIDCNGLDFQALQRTLGMPGEGPKCIPIRLDFTTILTYSLDLSNMMARAKVSMIQTVFADNSLSAQALEIGVASVDQTIKVPAGTQGYFPIICPNPARITFASTGGVVCKVILLNFPVFA